MNATVAKADRIRAFIIVLNSFRRDIAGSNISCLLGKYRDVIFPWSQVKSKYGTLFLRRDGLREMERRIRRAVAACPPVYAGQVMMPEYLRYRTDDLCERFSRSRLGAY